MTYPKLAVNKGRVSGSIVIDGTRLPIWAFIWQAIEDGWQDVTKSYMITDATYTADNLGEFLSNLFEQRNEFGELLLVLADVERLDRLLIDVTEDGVDALFVDWESRPDTVERVRAALQSCLDRLGE